MNDDLPGADPVNDDLAALYDDPILSCGVDDCEVCGVTDDLLTEFGTDLERRLNDEADDSSADLRGEASR